MEKDKKRKLYHYTSIENLLLILKTKSICFSSLENVDDMEEKETGDLQNFGRFYYVSCWNKSSRESIPLWTMYSQDMTGVRIELPEFPFKSFKYSKGEYGFETDTIEYVDMEKLYKNNKMSVIDGGIKLYDIEYTDDESLLYPKIKNLNVERLLKYDFSKLGRYKRSNWSFQEECRYGIFLAPWNMQYMEEIKNICKINLNASDKIISEAMNLLENPNTIIPSKRFYVDFDEEILKNLKILLGPKVTEAQEEIVKLIVKEYCPTAKISRSKLKIS